MRTLRLLFIMLSAVSVLTAAAQKLKPDSTKIVHSSTLTDLLRTDIAGMTVSTTDASSGAAAEIMLRGISAIRTTQQPLIIVDGVAMISSLNSGVNPWNLKYPYTNQSGSDAVSDPSFDNVYRPLDANNYQTPLNLLTGLDANIIESITILKNSSTTALYGARGANGVIIIKTLSHVKKARTIAFSSSVGVSIVGKKLDFLSSTAYKNYYQSLTSEPFDESSAKGVDWQKKLYSPAISTTNYLELSGSGIRTNYAVNMMYSLNNGIIDGTKQEQIALNAMIDRRISKIFKSGASVLLSKSAINLTQTTSLIGEQSTLKLVGAAPFDNAPYNAVGYANSYDDNSHLWRIMPRAYVNGTFGSMFSLDINGGIDILSQQRKRWAGNGTLIGTENNGIASIADYDRLNYDVNGVFSIKPVKNSNHKLSISLGGSYYGNRFTQQSVQGSDYFNHSLRANGVKLANNTSKMFYSVLNNQSYGVFADVSYAFKRRYEVKAGLRADWRIHIDNDFQYYPFAELGWNISNEKWFKTAVDSKIISKLKISGGWGISGQNDLSQYFLSDYFWLDSNPLQIPYQEQLNYLSGLKTTNAQYNAALDMAFMNDRIRLGITYYDGEVTDRLSVYDKQQDKSYSEVAANCMKMDKWGVEATLSATPIKRADWNWDITAALGFDRVNIAETSAIQKLASTGASGFSGRELGSEQVATAFVEGYSPAAFYGFRTDGIVGKQHLAFTPPFEEYRLQEGDIKFIDVNEDGVVNNTDKVIIGSPLPKMVASLSTTLRYKALSISMRFDGSFGNDVLNLNLLEWGNLSQSSNVLFDNYQQAWTAVNAGNKGPAIGAFGYDKITDRLVEDGSYIRFSDLMVAYSIPVCRVKWLSSLEVSLQVKNIFVASPYSGYNPAVNSFAGDWSARGIDLGAYPYARSFSLGVKVKF